MRIRKWNDEQLIEAVTTSVSFREVIEKLGLIPAGGNYLQVQQKIKLLGCNTKHFTGYHWNKGLKGRYLPLTPLKEVLVENSSYQSYKLKIRLYRENLKKPECEICGWNTQSTDGRIPVELDHINGDHFDNRIENLRILCPNCHSLQLTHRGINSKKHRKLSGW
jgi:hypothetical protein